MILFKDSSWGFPMLDQVKDDIWWIIKIFFNSQLSISVGRKGEITSWVIWYLVKLKRIIFSQTNKHEFCLFLLFRFKTKPWVITILIKRRFQNRYFNNFRPVYKRFSSKNDESFIIIISILLDLFWKWNSYYNG